MPSSRSTLFFLLFSLSLTSAALAQSSTKSAPATLKPFHQDIPTAAINIEMLPIPASTDGSIKPFWMSKTEITWDAYDVFAYRLDENPDDPVSDAHIASRPTKPYLPPDRGYGHEGYAAVSLTHKGATKFCEWLSKKSGKKFRLATEQEWEHACRATAPATARFSYGDDPADLPDHAWFKDNGEGTPHPVGKKKPNAWGLCDMHGNVREWVNAGDGSGAKPITPITKGGCYLDKAEDLAITARAQQQKSWNQTDPQLPKSTWWLSDGPFAGFRIICEADGGGGDKPAAAKPTDPSAKPEDRPGDKAPPPAKPPAKEEKK